jgi:hypothetical protein
MERKKRIGLLVLLFFALGLAGCSSAPEVPEGVTDQIMEIVRWNLNYASNEDLAGYMWTIHEDSPGYSQTQSMMEVAIDDFDLDYQLVTSELVSYSGDTAKVQVTQITRSKGSDPAFRDNQLLAVHTLKLSGDGKWKIYSSNFSDVEYLEP